jgi:hypothetical protein
MRNSSQGGTVLSVDGIFWHYGFLILIILIENCPQPARNSFGEVGQFPTE